MPPVRAFDVVSLAARALAGVWLLWRIPRPPGGAVRPPCSVVIPARDEARSLPAALAALVPQLRTGDEAVVVDDHSCDDTARLARDAGVRVVAAPPVPDGWTGKCAACWTGAAQTTNPVLCFLDADTTLAPGALDRLVATQADAGGLVSVQPDHRVPTAAEQLNAYFNVIAMMGVGAFTPLGDRRPPNGAFGPVLLVDRRDYVALDGHRAVAGELLDDVALAQRWRRAGRRVGCFGGRGSVAFRMYPGGLGSLIEGWTKNFASGARATGLGTLVLVALWLSVSIEATWRGVGLLAGADGPDATWVGVLYAAAAVPLWWMLRRIGSFRLVTALAFPVPLLVFLGVFVRSVVLTVTRRPVRWKGRRLPAGGFPAQPSAGRKTRSR